MPSFCFPGFFTDFIKGFVCPFRDGAWGFLPQLETTPKQRLVVLRAFDTLLLRTSYSSLHITLLSERVVEEYSCSTTLPNVPSPAADACATTATRVPYTHNEQVNAIDEKDLKQRFGVKKYPTLQYLHADMVEVYTGARDLDSMVHFLDYMVRPK